VTTRDQLDAWLAAADALLEERTKAMTEGKYDDQGGGEYAGEHDDQDVPAEVQDNPNQPDEEEVEPEEEEDS
jgi:hypothetical protein